MRRQNKKTILTASAISSAIALVTGFGLISAGKHSGQSFVADQLTSQTSTEHILSFNDLHGADVGFGDPDYSLPVSSKNPGIERMANAINHFKEVNPNTIVVSAGDNASGDAFGSWNHGEEVSKLNKALDVRYSAVGNHEWEWGGSNDLHRYQEFAQPDDEINQHYFITSNVLGDPQYQDKTDWVYNPTQPGFERDFKIWQDTRITTADPYRVVNIHGHPICLIGLTTKGTRTDGNKKYVSQLSFIEYKAAVNYAKYFAHMQLGDEEYSKIESFVLLTHIESYFDGSATEQTGARQLAAEIDTNIDAIISAHSHKKGVALVENPTLHKNIWVGQAETAGRCLLDTQFTFDDSKPVGEKLVGVHMDLENVPINYGGFDPSTQKEQAQEAAKKELLEIRRRAMFLPSDNPLRKTVQQFRQTMDKTLAFFNESVGKNSWSTGEKYPWSEKRDLLGHSYIWPSNSTDNPNYSQPNLDNLDENYLVDEAGAWIEYNGIKGFNQLQSKETNPLEPAAISLFYFDSVAGYLPGSEEQPQQVKRGNIYQMIPYDNSVAYGTITLGQLCNIIDYILAGEDAFVYGEQQNHNYLSDARDQETQIPLEHGLNYDPFTQQPCVNVTGDQDITIADSVYLAGPTQFWGMRFDVERYDRTLPEDNAKFTRRFRLKWIDGQPQVRIYDYKDKTQSLDKPDTWKPWDKDRLIPIITDSFIFGGGNGQARMIKPYMQYCLSHYPEQANLVEFTALPNRDLIFTSLANMSATDNIDVTKAEFRKLTTFLPQ